MNNIYRYKFSPEITNLISDFSKLHQFDSRNDFKEAWEIFYNGNSEIILQEKKRLEDLNFRGNFHDKLFKSARYYFRQKALLGNNENKTEIKKEEKSDKKRDYITLSTLIIDLMDEHIKNNINLPEYKPSTGYSNFCDINLDTIKREIEILITENENIDDDSISKKIKKAYKNRYYQFITHN